MSDNREHDEDPKGRFPREPAPITLSARDVAAYLLDRADQYELDSPCWIGLADAARNIMRGEVEAAKRNGEFDQSLYARVDALRAPRRSPSP